jgi:hypothetical protein
MHSNEPTDEAPREYLDPTRAEAEAIFERADLLLNFHYAISPKLLARFRRTALVDIDPGLLQFWISRGQLSVPPHDCYFTTSDAVGRPGGKIPTAVCPDSYPARGVPGYWPCAFRVRSLHRLRDSSDWIVVDETYENTKRVAFRSSPTCRG